MGGSSKTQNNINDEQVQFMQQLQNQYAQEFSQNEEIMKSLTSSLQPIINQGPQQEGYTPDELAALNTQAMQSASNSYIQSAQAANESAMAKGGGNTFLPSGAQEQVQGQIAANTENQLAANRANILQNSYTQGRNQFNQAIGALSGVPASIENPLSTSANSSTNAGNAAASEANAINSANNSWMGIAGGLLGGLGSAAITAGMK